MMADDRESENDLSRLLGLPKWLQGVVAIFVFVLPGLATQGASWFSDHLTKPVHGITVEDPERGTGTSKVFTQKILQYEVRNPGPGNLKEIELAITVPDEWDEQKHKFISELRCPAVNTSPPVCTKLDDGTTEVTIKPTVTDGASQLVPTARFGVRFISKDPAWHPVTAFLRYRGKNRIPADIQMAEDGYVTFMPSFWVLQIISWILLALGAVALLSIWLLVRRTKEWATKEAVRLAQPIVIQEVIKQVAALGQSKPPEPAEFKLLEQAATQALQVHQRDLPKLEGPPKG